MKQKSSSVSHLKKIIPLIAGGLVIITTLFFLNRLFIDQELAGSLITYRYAMNMLRGAGLTFNPGESFLYHAVSPGYTMLLVFASRIDADLPTLSRILGIGAIGVGAMVVSVLAYDEENPVGAVLAGAVFAAFPLLWFTLGLDASLWLALVLVAIWTHTHDWPVAAMVLVGLATFLRAESLILAVALIAESILTNRRIDLPAIGSYAGISLIGAIWLISAFEQIPILPGLPPGRLAGILPDIIAPNALIGSGVVVMGLISLSPLWLLLLLVTFPGFLSLRDHRPTLIMVGWMVLHVVTLGILRVAVYSWSFLPLAPMIALLLAQTLKWLSKQIKPTRLRGAIVGGVCLFFFMTMAHSYTRIINEGQSSNVTWRILRPEQVSPTGREVGLWLNANTPSDARIGITGDVWIGYWADRTFLDYQGGLQPALFAAQERQDSLWWIADTQPDYLVLGASEYPVLDGYDLAADPVFMANYTQVAVIADPSGEGNDLLIFQQIAESPALTNQLVGMVVYDGGLTLNGIATDFELDPLTTGQPGRVRLEWLLESPIEGERIVIIRIMSRSGAIVGLAERHIDFTDWPRRDLLTTYHSIDLLPGQVSGVYDIEVGIGTTPQDIVWRSIVRAKIPFQTETFVGGISGTRVDFGDIALLGYRVISDTKTLKVSLIWQGQKLLYIDYRIILQVRDSTGAIVAQTEAEPHEGTYPTSIWSPGEEVPDTYTLDIEGLLPGNYEVYAGLISPDGERLRALDGSDLAFVGNLTILEGIEP